MFSFERIKNTAIANYYQSAQEPENKLQDYNGYSYEI